MKMVKSLVLGSAAGLLAMGGAQAADLPVKAKAVEYVRICSLYGAGFFYIPGTDTCIKIGGYLRADLTIHGGASDQPFWSGDGAVNDRYENEYNDYSRLALTFDTRTATEYGVVRAFGQGDFTFATEGVGNSIGVQSSLNPASLTGGALNNFVGGGYATLEFAFVQFAGFTLGKSASAFNTPWHGYPGNQNTAYLVGGYDTVTGINNIQYTAQFGNGVSASIGVDDSSANDYNRTQIFNAVLSPQFGANNVSNTTFLVPGTANADACNFGGYGAASSNCTSVGTAYSGTMVPDIVGNVKVDQAWGLFQLSGALHAVSPGYWATANDLSSSQFVLGSAVSGAGSGGQQNLGHPDTKYGGAISAALQLKNLPTGPGDDIKVDATASWGASKYVLGTSAALGGSFYMFGSSSAPGLAGTGTAGKIAIGAITDGVYGGFGTSMQAGVQLTRGWGFRGAFNHNWDAYWSTSIFGGVAGLSYNDTAKNLWCAAYAGLTPTGGALSLGTSTGVTGVPVQKAAVSADYKCDPGFTMSEIGLVTRWTPVKNLTFSGEVLYAYLKTNMQGSAVLSTTSAFPIPVATYQYGSMGTASVNFRVQRNF
jgi:hypothetical protein